MTTPPAAERTRLRRALLAWYDRERRDLPWRATLDPYAIWISEAMLQQTRAGTVRRYYRRFLRRFPTVRALARARESAVLAAWSGLGYYARARNLRWAARLIVERHGGNLPADPEALAALPGFGSYTVGAVGSIAFDLRLPVVDGNVARVLARLFAVEGSSRAPAVRRTMWGLASVLVPRRRPGDWNQALMELGATVCTPRDPECGRCPLRRCCAAYRTGRVDRFPSPSPRRASRDVRRAVAAAAVRGRYLLVRVDRDEPLRGLWQFPGVTLENGDDERKRLRRELRRLGVAFGRLEPLTRIRHSIMNQRIETQVFRALRPRLTRPLTPSPHERARWIAGRSLGSIPLSTVGLRIVREFITPAGRL